MQPSDASHLSSAMSRICLTRHWCRQHPGSAAASEECHVAIKKAASAWLQPCALVKVQESIQHLLEPQRHCAAHQAALLLTAFSAAARTAVLSRVRQ